MKDQAVRIAIGGSFALRGRRQGADRDEVLVGELRVQPLSDGTFSVVRTVHVAGRGSQWYGMGTLIGRTLQVLLTIEDGTGHRFAARYELSADGQSVRELVLNASRLGAEAWWSKIESRGVRLSSAASAA